MKVLELAVLVTVLVFNREGLSDNDRLWLARAVQGEVGVMGEYRKLTGSWVVHVALNRLEAKAVREGSPWEAGDLSWLVYNGFFGARREEVSEPEEWAFKIVDDALEQRAESGDVTQGAMYILGGIDINECIDWESHIASVQRPGWLFSVHLFKQFPYVSGCVR